MAFCKNCGNQIEEGSKFCSSCGANLSAQAEPNEQTEQTQQTPVSEPIQTESFSYEPQPEKASGALNVVQLVWSIINIISCCTPLGIVALIMTIIAKDAPTQVEEQKKLKTAKICNLVGTLIAVVGLVLYIVLVVAGAVAGVFGAM